MKRFQYTLREMVLAVIAIGAIIGFCIEHYKHQKDIADYKGSMQNMEWLFRNQDEVLVKVCEGRITEKEFRQATDGMLVCRPYQIDTPQYRGFIALDDSHRAIKDIKWKKE